jgi:hypothetical protein
MDGTAPETSNVERASDGERPQDAAPTKQSE